jgi:hypothetical protein
MKKSTIILILILISIHYGLFSQKVIVSSETQNFEYTEEVPVARYVGNTFLEMRNQFQDDWKNGDIILTNGKVITNQIIKYNNYLDELAWLRSSDYKMGIILKESITGFTLYADNSNAIRVFKKVPLNKLFIDENKESFVQVLFAGNDTVICLRKFNKAGPTDEYKLTNQFFLQKNGEFSRFFLQRASVLNLFNDDEKLKMKSIIRSNHLWVRKEKNMIKAFEMFYAGK